jgi:DNA-binding FrmR family transcriptional regulator
MDMDDTLLDQQIRAERKRLEKLKKKLIKEKYDAEYRNKRANKIIDEMLDEFHTEKNSSGRIQPWKDAIKIDNKVINELEDQIEEIEKQLAALKPVKSESILTQVASLPSRLFRTTRMLTVAPISSPTVNTATGRNRGPTYIYGGNKRFKTRKSRRGSRQKKNKKRKTKKNY